jgi:predicted helicase
MLTFQNYLDQIVLKFQNGDSSERTYYTVLHDLIKSFLENEMSLPNVSVDIEPRSLNSKYSEERLGIPDLRITSNNNLLGYIECKDIGTDLDKIQKTEQLRKYKNLPNLLLTNFLEWRWWDGKVWVKLPNIGQNVVIYPLENLKNKHISPENKADFTGLNLLLNQFFNFGRTVLETRNSDQLAQVLAKRAKSLEYVLDISLEEGQTAENEILFTLWETLKNTFDQNLQLNKFASLYAETIAYSALITKLDNSNEIKTSNDIINNIPEYIPILKQFFGRFGETKGESRQIYKAVEDVLNVVLKSDITSIQEELRRTYHPIYHFYETFLKYFKPEAKAKLGVYYTPEPVVKFIVQSTIKLLKNELDKNAIDPEVVWLDPAVGTGTFLFYLIDEIIKSNPNLTKEIYQDFILSNVFGFEIQLPSYVMAHLKLARQMENFGLNPAEILAKYPILPQTQKNSFKPGFRLYLTNSLKDISDKKDLIYGFEKLTKEVNETNEVKDGKVLVILGNPPYNGKSENIGSEFKNIHQYLENYKKALVNDQGNFETKHNVDNDYIKFLAWSTAKIEQNGTGIVAMVAGNSFLDSPTMKLVRQELLTVYDKIYITDLHGRILTLNEGEKDQNVFGIKDSGVCIFFLVKNDKDNNLDNPNSRISQSRKVKIEIAKNRQLKSAKEKNLALFKELERYATAKIYHNEVSLNNRENKLKEIAELELKNENYTKLEPKSPNFQLHPVSQNTEYKSWWSIVEIFRETTNGVKTHRDHFVFDVDKNSLIQRLKDYWNFNNSLYYLSEKYELKDVEGFNVEGFRKKFSLKEDLIVKCLYRPFDVRWLYFENQIVQRARKDIFAKTYNSQITYNPTLIVKRQNRKKPFSYFFVTDKITESCFFEATYANANLCPLYILKDQKEKENKEQTALNLEQKQESLVEINFTDKFQNYIKTKFQLDFEGWEKQVFAYIYGFLHNPTYGEKYFEFLQYDFPRINFEVSKEEFEKVAALGQKLIDLHLFKNVPKNPEIRFEKMVFEKIGVYDENKQIWYLQHGEAIVGVSPEVWEYKIGGYQVLATLWKNRLKDMERSLNLQEKQWLLEVINCLNETVDLLQKFNLLDLPQN